MNDSREMPAHTTVRVDFNQQQRQLVQKLRSEDSFAKCSDGEIVRIGFVTWLRSQGHVDAE